MKVSIEKKNCEKVSMKKITKTRGLASDDVIDFVITLYCTLQSIIQYFRMQKNSQGGPEVNSQFSKETYLTFKFQGCTIHGKKVNFRVLSSIISSSYPFILNIQRQQNQTICLQFESMDDLVDFNFGKSIGLGMTKIFSLNEETDQLTSEISQSQEKIINQISEEGFQLDKGKIKLKKLTSLDNLIRVETMDQKLDTTNYPTETYIPLFEDFEQNEKILKDGLANEEGKRGIGNLIKPFFDGIVFTTLIFGGYKLFKLLRK